MRLAKYLAGCGVASRRACEQIIRSGAVTVDGACVTDPARDVDASRRVEVDGRPIGPARGTVVYAINKPAGVVSTASDPQGRPTVVALVPGERRLYPVGRLDAGTTGLILLTDDGELAHRLTHPRFGVEKTYRVRVQRGPVPERALRQLRDGVELDDGLTAPARVRRVSADTLELTIHEGRKRQVRRMCEAVGHRVLALERVRLGPLELGDLRPGAYRQLNAAEVSLLRAAGSAPRTGVSRPAAARAGSGPGRRAADAPRRASGS